MDQGVVINREAFAKISSSSTENKKISLKDEFKDVFEIEISLKIFC